MRSDLNATTNTRLARRPTPNQTGLVLGLAILLATALPAWAQQAAIPVNSLETNFDQVEAGFPDGSMAAGYAPGGPAIIPPIPDPADDQWFGACDVAGIGIPPKADRAPVIGMYLFTSFDSWRSITTGDLPSNAGVTQGINVGAPLPYLGKYGIGMQLGASYSAANFSGQPGLVSTNEPLQQIFITGGFYRRADADRRISWGMVYDLMINDNFGAFATGPTLGQFRAQVAYALGYWNEIGVWGAFRDFGDNKINALGNNNYYQAMGQVNLFWHHKYGCGGADSWFYVGAPNQTRLTDPLFGGGGTLGEFTIGGSLNVPINDWVALYGNGSYMKPSSHPSSFGAIENAWNISFGLAFYPGRAARSSSVAGRSAMPYMPVANNGSFMVNTNGTL